MNFSNSMSNNYPRPVEELIKEEFGFIPQERDLEKIPINDEEQDEKVESQQDIVKPHLLTETLSYQDVEN